MNLDAFLGTPLKEFGVSYHVFTTTLRIYTLWTAQLSVRSCFLPDHHPIYRSIRMSWVAIAIRHLFILSRSSTEKRNVTTDGG